MTPTAPPAATNIAWSGKTDPGRFRNNNEDAFLALRFDTRELQRLGKDGEAPIGDWDYCFAVSDGMGGANAGEFASRIAVDKIAELLPRSFSMAASGLHDAALDLLPELYAKINSAMRDMGEHYEECARMGATLSLCWFGPRRMLFAHIGDSRIYYLPAGGALLQISRDDNAVWRQMRAGKLNVHQYRAHPERNLLEKVLGGGTASAEPQVGVVEYAPGDQFLLCSDGVSGTLFDRRLETLLRDPPANLALLTHSERFVRDAMDEGTRDNATAVWVAVA